jgi:lipopolysaccharide export system permease protein
VKIFTVSSAGFVGLMVIIGLTQEALDHGLGPDVIFQLTPYVLPKALMFAMPATCLFSTCVVFGRLSADNEIIAIESLGLPKSVVVMPALVMAFLLSLVAVWMNDISFAWSYWGVEKVVLESSDKIIYGVLRTEGSFSTPKFTIEVDAVEDRTLINPVITVKSDKPNSDARIVAQQAVLSTHPDTHSLNFTMTNGMADIPGKAAMQFEDSFSQLIPLKSPEEIAKSTGNPSHLYLSQIKRAIVKQKSGLAKTKASNALTCATQLFSGDFVALTNEQWPQRLKQEQDATHRLNRLHVVPHRRWANGFSCLAFVIIGIPVAMQLKTSNYANTFGACFLPILFLYYPLFMFGLNGAKQGTLPPFAAWLGDVACISIGIILLIREFRR